MKDISYAVADIKAIADHVRAIDPDDEGLLADMIEGETDANEIMDLLLDAEATANAHIAANKARIADLSDRNTRFSARIDTARSAMEKLLDAAGVRKWERPSGTVSMRLAALKLIGDDAGALPGSMVTLVPKVDRKAVKRAIEDGHNFPGWSLSNGGQTISVRRK